MKIITYFVSILVMPIFMVFLVGRPLIQEMLEARSINAGDFLIDGTLIMILLITIVFAFSKK